VYAPMMLQLGEARLCVLENRSVCPYEGWVYCAWCRGSGGHPCIPAIQAPLYTRHTSAPVYPPYKHPCIPAIQAPLYTLYTPQGLLCLVSTQPRMHTSVPGVHTHQGKCSQWRAALSTPIMLQPVAGSPVYPYHAAASGGHPCIPLSCCSQWRARPYTL
jgi:hypothetical protein